jgi:hypothetical protein
MLPYTLIYHHIGIEMTEKKQIAPQDQYKKALEIVAAKKNGRPTTFNQEIADYIIEKMVEDGQEVAVTCRELGIPKSTVYGWATIKPHFSFALAQGRQALADDAALKIMEIADNTSSETAQGDRVRLDALKWISSRLYPNKYSEKSALAITGSDGGPVQLQAVQVNTGSMDETSREILRQTLISASRQAGDDVSEFEDEE